MKSGSHQDQIMLAQAVIVVCLLGLYLYAHDPLFLVLLAVVGFGLVLTGTSYLHDRRG